MLFLLNTKVWPTLFRDVKRGQTLEAEVEAEAEAKFEET